MPDAETALLLEMIDQAYDKKSWHGPNLRGSVRGLSARQAAWRPASDRHSIAEQVVHAAYWKYTVRRRLRDDRRGSFPLKGSNWFPVSEDLVDPDWRTHTRLLESEHRSLREAVAGLTPSQLTRTPPGGTVSFRDLVLGVASHDLYHAGQIQLLKRLQGQR